MKTLKTIIILFTTILSLSLFADELILSDSEKKFIEENKKIKIALMPDFHHFLILKMTELSGLKMTYYN